MDEKQQSLSELRRDWSGTRRCILRTRLQRSCDSRDITKANPFPGSGNLALVDGDIGDSKTAAKVVETVVSRFGRVNVLVNNAGIFIPKPFSEYTTEGLNALVSTTLAGFLYISQVSVKQMLRQKSGNIVNVSTTLVRHPVAGVPVTVQVMAKGALDAVRGRSRSNMPRTAFA